MNPINQAVMNVLSLTDSLVNPEYKAQQFIAELGEQGYVIVASGEPNEPETVALYCYTQTCNVRSFSGVRGSTCAGCGEHTYPGPQLTDIRSEDEHRLAHEARLLVRPSVSCNTCLKEGLGGRR